MTERKITIWTWTARVLTLLGLLAGVLAAAKQLPVEIRDYAALVVALLGVGNGWINGFLPARKTRAAASMVLLAIAALLMLSAGCKVPPLATAYRSHALLLTARDGAGAALEKTQRAQMIKCEADTTAPLTPKAKSDLLACYRKVRAPVSAWVTRIKPAITAAASALWLLLEIAYVAGDTALSKNRKAASVACSALEAAEAALEQYADKLGELRTVVLGAIAGGKVLVCH